MSYNITGNYTNNVDTASGAEVKVDLEAGANAFNAHEASIAEHGATGANVGTTNVQTLTNKTIYSDLSNTTTDIVKLVGDSLTTSSLLNLSSNSSDTSARDLIKLVNDNTAATGTKLLRLQQDSTGDMLRCFDGTDLTTRINGSGQVIAPMLVPGQVQNLSWTKSAGTITIASADGTALSSDNPGWVCMPSASNNGQFVTLKVTSNVTFNDDDHASSDLTNWTFGVTSGVAWNENMPIFIKALNKDDTDAGLVFGISRDPRDILAGVGTALIGDKDAVAATDSQKSIFVAGSITEADYNTAPVMTVGAASMKKVAVADDWTIVDSANNGFGEQSINRICSIEYVYPTGQNGARSGTHITSSTNNVPTWATPANVESLYYLARDGNVTVSFFTGNAGDCTQDPAAAGNSLYFALPLSFNGNAVTTVAVSAGFVGYAGTGYCAFVSYGTDYNAQINYLNGNMYSVINENMLGDSVSDDLAIPHFTYKAF